MKRLISILMILTMMLSTLPTTFALEDTEAPISDEDAVTEDMVDTGTVDEQGAENTEASEDTGAPEDGVTDVQPEESTESETTEQPESEDQQSYENQDQGEQGLESETDDVEQLEEANEPTYELKVITEGQVSLNGEAVVFDENYSEELDLNITINPYKKFESSIIEITNTGDTTIEVSTGSINTVYGPTVVSPHTFSDWYNLSAYQTQSNIAIGLKVNGWNTWFAGEGSSLYLETLEPGDTMTLEMIVKHGMAWAKEVEVSYECSLEFNTIPYEYQVETILDETQVETIIDEIVEIQTEATEEQDETSEVETDDVYDVTDNTEIITPEVDEEDITEDITDVTDDIENNDDSTIEIIEPENEVESEPARDDEESTESTEESTDSENGDVEE